MKIVAINENEIIAIDGEINQQDKNIQILGGLVMKDITDDITKDMFQKFSLIEIMRNLKRREDNLKCIDDEENK